MDNCFISKRIIYTVETRLYSAFCLNNFNIPLLQAVLAMSPLDDRSLQLICASIQ